MVDVFPALEQRFNANKQLVRLARRLYQGHSNAIVKVVRTHVEVTCTGMNHEYDTFDTDEPVYSLAFAINTKDARPDRAAKVMREMVATFDDADVVGAAFTCVSMRLTNANGPYLEDGTYRALMDFDLHVCMKTKVPIERALA